MTVSVWSESGYGMTQKRSAGMQVKRTCLRQGLYAPADWATTNSNSDRRDLDVPVSMLKSGLNGSIGHAVVAIGESSIRKWKK